MTDKLAELGRGYDFDAMGFTLGAWRLMADLGLKMRMPEVGDKYGTLFIENEQGQIVFHYDMMERRIWFRQFTYLTASLDAVRFRMITARVHGFSQLNQAQLRDDALAYVLQHLHDFAVERFPGVRAEQFGQAWGLLVSQVNSDTLWKKPYLDIFECMTVIQNFPGITEEEIDFLLGESLPVLALEGHREGLHPRIMRELYGTKKWDLA